MDSQTTPQHPGLEPREPPTYDRSGESWQPRRAAIGRLHVGALWVAAALAVVPGLPFVQSDATAFVRVHNWAIFAAGLILGWVVADARGSLG